MSAPAASAAAAAALEEASSSQSQPPPQSFSELHNNTQAPAAAAAAMLPQSLTQHILPPSAPTPMQQQFFDTPAVQQRLTAACAAFSDATAALQKATEGRDRFINSGSKQGGSKQLPAKLDWKLCKAAHLSSDAVPANFYASDQATLRAIEREATDKAYDALLAAKDKHIAFLKERCVLRNFVTTTANSFQPELQRIAAEFNGRSQADAFAPSQADFTFPLDAVTKYFHSELLRRLTAQTLAAVDAKQQEEQRLAQQRTEEHKSQEIVLAGAHTGKTISMLAETAATKQLRVELSPLLQKLADIEKRLPQQSSRQSHPAKQQSRHRAPHSGASPSAPEHSQHSSSASKPQSRLVVIRKQDAAKRSRQKETEDDTIEHDPPASSSKQYQHGTGNKRHKLTVTFATPKNGEGGDRPPRSDQQQQRSSQRADAHHRNNAKNKGRGPRYSDQQPQSHQ